MHPLSTASSLVLSRASCGKCRQASFRRSAVVALTARRRWKTSSSTCTKSSKSNASARQDAAAASASKVDRPSAATSFPLPKAFGIGTLAGALGSLAGMGGGFVMIPLMTSPLLLRLPQHSAHGTSLFAVAATGIAGALSYASAGIDIELDSVVALTTAAMFTARLGAQTTARLSERRLKLFLGIFMLGVAPLVPAKSYIAERFGDENGEVDGGEERHGDGECDLINAVTEDDLAPAMISPEGLQRLAVSGTIGLGSGFLAGLFGVGGGAIVVPALTLATDMSHYQALGTSLMAMTLPACVGTFTHYQRGNVAMRVAPALAAGAFAGAYMGGRIGTNIEEDKLRWGFSGLMVALGLRTITKSF